MIIALLAGIATGVFATIAWYKFKNRSRPTKRFKLITNPNTDATPQLRAKLLNLAGGDMTAVDNWLASARFGHSGHSESWYYYRAIQMVQQKQRLP